MSKGLHWTGAAASVPGPAFREHAVAAAGCEPIEAEGVAGVAGAGWVSHLLEPRKLWDS